MTDDIVCWAVGIYVRAFTIGLHVDASSLSIALVSIGLPIDTTHGCPFLRACGDAIRLAATTALFIAKLYLSLWAHKI
jgi:hypothetical protein